jgi:hypothetical protein
VDRGTTVESKLFLGWTGTNVTGTYAQWCKELVKHYNTDPPKPTTEITTVPGYTGKAKFLDVADIAEQVFDYRTGN